MENQFDFSHIAGHAISLGAIFGGIAGWFPAIAGIVALIWYGIQIWESKTVQHYVANRRTVHKARRIARLLAKEKLIRAQLEALEVVRVARKVAQEKVAIAAKEAEELKASQETEIHSNLPPV